MELYFLVTPFLAGISGSVHCLGMCGPIVSTVITAPGVCPVKQRSFGYSLGRGIGYTTMGALFGLLGKLIDFSAGFANIRAGAVIVGGGVMILYGFSTLGLGTRWSASLNLKNLSLLRPVFQRALHGPTFASTLVLGLATALLPCHLLLPMQAMAAASGSPILGAGILSVFWLGTLPLLLGFGALVGHLKKEMKERINQIIALIMILTGIGLILSRWL